MQVSIAREDGARAAAFNAVQGCMLLNGGGAIAGLGLLPITIPAEKSILIPTIESVIVAIQYFGWGAFLAVVSLILIYIMNRIDYEISINRYNPVYADKIVFFMAFLIVILSAGAFAIGMSSIELTGLVQAQS